ncbi:MAG: hypothetical protein IT462_14450 [Planctomycetes bacterium]|nr:hypothetical protein [Planctomycetota bacterium]
MGLLMRGLLESSLAGERGRAAARKLRGDVRICAGTMSVTMSFSADEIVLRASGNTRPRANVRGEMKPLLEMVAGGGLIGPVLRGKVKVRGNLLMLLRLLPLIRPSRKG